MQDLSKALMISASAMQAQGTRIRVAAENMANANSTGEGPGDLPYRRQVVTFVNEFDRALGLDRVEVGTVRPDTSPFDRRFDPSHPAADQEGYVLYPNVTTTLEMMDIREARRSYEANLNVITTARSMVMQTIDLLSRR